MTQREPLRADDHRAEVYEAPATSRPVATQPAVYRDESVAVATPTDRIRWGPVIAGLFAALSTLATLTILGLAIGTAVFDPNDQASTYGIGAGIWGAVSALLAFLVGGWLAARTSAVPGRNAGILNGAMVWFVAIPLLLFGIGSGVGAIARTLGNVAGTAAAVAAPLAGEAAGDPALQQQAQTEGQDAAAAAQQQAQQLQQQATDPQTQQEIADTISANAWRVLLSLGLAAAAAIGGGALGARTAADRRIHESTV
jgi:hypothetical protein